MTLAATELHEAVRRWVTDGLPAPEVGYELASLRIVNNEIQPTSSTFSQRSSKTLARRYQRLTPAS